MSAESILYKRIPRRAFVSLPAAAAAGKFLDATKAFGSYDDPGEYAWQENDHNRDRLRIDIKPEKISFLNFKDLQVFPQEESQNGYVANEDGTLATPSEHRAALANTSWIFAHSRFNGRYHPFVSLQDLKVGNKINMSGVSWDEGFKVNNATYTVEGLCITNRESGQHILNVEEGENCPYRPTLILQTSAREEGLTSEGTVKPWILDRQKLEKKALNFVPKNLIDDPDEYIFLFVVAKMSNYDVVRLKPLVEQ